jgi:hypothetical protein
MGLRHAAAITLIVLAYAVPSAQRIKPTPEHALALARAYLAVWQDVLTSLVAEEEYEQHVTAYVRNLGPGASKKRHLRSEVLLLRAPADNVWLSFRDVIAVDGTIVSDRDRQHRFDDLFSGPVAMMMSTAERIAEEGARFNLGRLTRTINTPTAAIVFLDRQYEANTRWQLASDKRLDGIPAWQLRFEQRKPPFAVKMPGAFAYSCSGQFHLEPGTGRILAWELLVRSGRSTFRVKMRYGSVPSVQEGWVPLRMEDDYDVPQFERLRGVATYTNHRLFRTRARIIGPF